MYRKVVKNTCIKRHTQRLTTKKVYVHLNDFFIVVKIYSLVRNAEHKPGVDVFRLGSLEQKNQHSIE